VPDQELRATAAQLAAARVDIEEREALILAHATAEASLAGHALGLTAGLDGAAANIGALFQRWRCCAHSVRTVDSACTHHLEFLHPCCVRICARYVQGARMPRFSHHVGTPQS
jgi:hypothetical protein